MLILPGIDIHIIILTRFEVIDIGKNLRIGIVLHDNWSIYCQGTEISIIAHQIELFDKIKPQEFLHASL